MKVKITSWSEEKLYAEETKIWGFLRGKITHILKNVQVVRKLDDTLGFRLVFCFYFLRGEGEGVNRIIHLAAKGHTFVCLFILLSCETFHNILIKKPRWHKIKMEH